MSSHVGSGEVEEENEVNEIVIDADIEEEESLEELDKINKIQREKEIYVR